MRLTVENMERDAARRYFARYHYTGSAGGSRFFAVYDDIGAMVCAVAVGRGGNRFGVGDKFGLSPWNGDVEITRVACNPSAPRNTASASVAAVCDVLASEGVEWLFSYADTAQNHHGGIYQALGAVFVGTDARQWVNFAIDGKRVAKRKVSGRYGHTRWPEVRDIAALVGEDLRRVPWMPKLLYILPVAAHRKTKREIRKALSRFALPYPKQGDDLTGMATPYRNSREQSA